MIDSEDEVKCDAREVRQTSSSPDLQQRGMTRGAFIVIEGMFV